MIKMEGFKLGKPVTLSKGALHAMKPIMVISRASATSTIRLDSTCSQSRPWTAFLYLILTISIIHLFAIPSLMVYIENKLRVTSTNFDSATAHLTLHFFTKMFNQILVSTVAVICRQLIGFQMHKHFATIIKQMKKADNLMSYSFDKRDGRRLFTLCVATLVLTLPFQLYSIVYMHHLSNAFVFGINLYNVFGTVCCELQFVGLCVMLYARFKVVNESVDKMSKAKGSIKFYTVANLRTLRTTHAYLLSSCEVLGEHYSCILLVTLTACFLNGLFNFYYAIFGGFKTTAEGNQDRTPYEISNDALWGAFYFIRFFIVCFAASKLTTEGNLTKLNLCAFLDAEHNKNLKEELKIFLKQCCIRKVRFTACGLFEIKMALITSAVASGTTYLVILAQFQNA